MSVTFVALFALFFGPVIWLHLPWTQVQEEIPDPIAPVTTPQNEPVTTPQDPRIVVLQTIPRAADVLIKLPQTEQDLVWIQVEAVGKSLHIRYSDNFEKQLDFNDSVYVNRSEYRGTELQIDLSIGD